MYMAPVGSRSPPGSLAQTSSGCRTCCAYMYTHTHTHTHTYTYIYVCIHIALYMQHLSALALLGDPQHELHRDVGRIMHCDVRRGNKTHRDGAEVVHIYYMYV